MLLRVSLYWGPKGPRDRGDCTIDPHYILAACEGEKNGHRVTMLVLANGAVFNCWDDARDVVRRWTEAHGDMEPPISDEDLPAE